MTALRIRIDIANYDIANKLLDAIGPSVTDPDIAEIFYQLDTRITKLVKRTIRKEAS